MRLVICNHARACRPKRHEGKNAKSIAAAKLKHFLGKLFKPQNTSGQVHKPYSSPGRLILDFDMSRQFRLMAKTLASSQAQAHKERTAYLQKLFCASWA